MKPPIPLLILIDHKTNSIRRDKLKFRDRSRTEVIWLNYPVSPTKYHFHVTFGQSYGINRGVKALSMWKTGGDK